MSKRNDVHISTGNMEQFGQDFIKAWKEGEQGKAVAIDSERVCFMDLATMLSTLSEKRLEILRTLQGQAGITTYKLAQLLGRDYKNVHTDVGMLKDIGLIQVGDDGGLMVPYTRIQAEINLAA
jgi:predicted transcriptional regulator